MEPRSIEKKSKSGVKSAYAVIRVGRETHKRLAADITKVNKKDFGKKVRLDELVALAIGLVEPKHLQQLQEGSLSNQDRLERDYRVYVEKYGSISKDDYLGKRLRGEIDAGKAPHLDASDKAKDQKTS